MYQHTPLTVWTNSNHYTARVFYNADNHKKAGSIFITRITEKNKEMSLELQNGQHNLKITKKEKKNPKASH